MDSRKNNAVCRGPPRRRRRDLTMNSSLRGDAVHNRHRIMQAARDLFAVEGLRPNLNDVARHAGVGVGTVYRRFATKEALLDVIFEDVLNQLGVAAEEALSNDPWHGFAGFVGRMCELSVHDRGLRDIAFSEDYGGPVVRAARARLGVALGRLVDRTKSSGRLRNEVSHHDLNVIGLLVDTVSDFAGQVEGPAWRTYMATVLDGMQVRRVRKGLHPDTG